MSNRDALMSSVTIILDDRYVPERVEEVVDQLKAQGVLIDTINPEAGLVDGLVETGKVHGLEKLDSVDYVRTQFSYVADYPTGDLRDLDRLPPASSDPFQTF